MLRHAPGSGR